MKNQIIKMFSTFFYSGYFPIAPGSFASAAAVLFAYFFHQTVAGYVIAFLVLTVVGFILSGPMEKIVGRKDPGCIVIDEAAGIMISFFLLPWEPSVIWTAFFLFRAFDMFKIFPADRFEAKGGGYGIMMDDIVAGIYTNIIMQIAIRLAGLV